MTTIAAKLKTPQRFAGFHFFNPVPLMQLVEVIAGLLTEDWVCEALMALGKRMTREPVRCTDAPGFLVNQVGRGFTLEAAHLVYEGVSSFADVDRVMRDVGGFRMGPFELMELTGLDVTQPASELIYNQFFQEPRYRPNLIMQSRYEAGVLGRKTKKGFYDYDAEMKPIVAPEAPAPAARPGAVSGSARPSRTGHAVLTELLTKLGATRRNRRQAQRQGADPGDADRRRRDHLRGGAGTRSRSARSRSIRCSRWSSAAPS